MQWLSNLVTEKGQQCWAILGTETLLFEKGVHFISDFLSSSLDNRNSTFIKL
jgi:hypothetical protein